MPLYKRRGSASKNKRNKRRTFRDVSTMKNSKPFPTRHNPAHSSRCWVIGTQKTSWSASSCQRHSHAFPVAKAVAASFSPIPVVLQPPTFQQTNGEKNDGYHFEIRPVDFCGIHWSFPSDEERQQIPEIKKKTRTCLPTTKQISNEYRRNVAFFCVPSLTVRPMRLISHSFIHQVVGSSLDRQTVKDNQR